MATKYKIITNKNFHQLAQLTIEMYKLVDPKLNSFNVIDDLILKIKTNSGFIAFGVFEKNILVGCLYGYAINKKTFHFDGLYCFKKPTRLQMLINFSLKKLKELKYTHYTAQTTNKRVIKLFKQFKAKTTKETIVTCKGEI